MLSAPFRPLSAHALRGPLCPHRAARPSRRGATPSTRCCSLPETKAKGVPARYLILPNSSVMNSSVSVHIGGEAKRQPVEWDAVAISPEAKALLQQHAVKPSTALQLHDILGFEDVDDVQRLTPDLVAQLKLKPLQLDPLLDMLRQGVHTQQLRGPESKEGIPLTVEAKYNKDDQGQQQKEQQQEQQQQQQHRAAAPHHTTAPAPVVSSSSFYLAISPDGRHALASDGKAKLEVRDLATGARVAVMEGHEDAIWSAAITPDGSKAVSGGKDRVLRVWDLATYRCIATLEGHTDMVPSVAITPDERQAVSASWDNTLRLWDLDTSRCIATLEGHAGCVSCVAVTPDGRTAVSGSWDRTLRLWDLATHSCIATLEGHAHGVSAVAVSPDGRQAVSGSYDASLRLWDLATRACTATLDALDTIPEWYMGKVTCVAITPDGRHAVSGGNDVTLRLWDLATRTCIAIREGDAVDSLVITPDGRHVLASADCAYSEAFDSLATTVWDLEQARKLSTAGL